MRKSIIIKYPRSKEVQWESKIQQVLEDNKPPGHDKKSINFVVKEEVIQHNIQHPLGL